MGFDSRLDADQVIRKSFDDSQQALKTFNLGATLVPEKFNEISLTYVTSGSGLGEIASVTYKQDSVVIATLTLTYNGSNQLINVVRT